jgi:uncharacterized protein (DUF433 family)
VPTRPKSDSEWIVSDPRVLGGRPHIRGTQITVESVLERVGSGSTIDQIAADTPDLTLEAVKAALRYASTHVRPA